jgi:hypothetical protein
MTEIKLDRLDACVIWREDGGVEVVLPDRPGDEEVPLNCMLASIAAAVFTDRETMDRLLKLVEERCVQSDLLSGEAGSERAVQQEQSVAGRHEGSSEGEKT